MSPQKRIGEQDVIAAFREAAAENGVARSSQWWRDHPAPGRMSKKVIFGLFGDWDAACHAAQLESPREARARERAEREAERERARAERAEAARLAAERKTASARAAAAQREQRARERLQRAAERDARVRAKREQAQAQAQAARPGYESRMSRQRRERSEARRAQLDEDIATGLVRVRQATPAERQQWETEREARASRYVPADDELHVPGSRVKQAPDAPVDEDTAGEAEA